MKRTFPAGRAADALERFNAFAPEAAERELLEVCGSRAWARRVARARPFADREALDRAAEAAWDALAPEDWEEAFGAHPRIGESRPARGERASAWSQEEQARAAEDDASTRARLAEAQRRYETRFGRVFLIRAAGRSAVEIVAACEARLENDPLTELEIAAGEEREIGRLRLERYLKSDRETSER